MVCITTFRANNSESKQDFDELTINSTLLARYGIRASATGATPLGYPLDRLAFNYEISSRAGQALPLRVGMKGDAQIIVGSRTLIEYAFEPIRQLRESIKQ